MALHQISAVPREGYDGFNRGGVRFPNHPAYKVVDDQTLQVFYSEDLTTPEKTITAEQWALIQAEPKMLFVAPYSKPKAEKTDSKT